MQDVFEPLPIFAARWSLIAMAFALAPVAVVIVAGGAICDLLEARVPGQSISQQWLRSHH